jgi:hypothetical protein
MIESIRLDRAGYIKMMTSDIAKGMAELIVQELEREVGRTMKPPTLAG